MKQTYNVCHEFAAYRKQVFADNYVKKGKKYWNTASGNEKIYQLKSGSEINVVMLQEDITKGQRIEAFTVEALTDNSWKEVAKGTTVGYKRLLRFPTIKADQLRIKILESRLMLTSAMWLLIMQHLYRKGNKRKTGISCLVQDGKLCLQSH